MEIAPKLYPCPCCGYMIFEKPPNSNAICPICFWEDDLVQLRFPTTTGANRLPLYEAQHNFQRLHAKDARSLSYARPPRKGEVIDQGWRLIDRQKDAFESWEFYRSRNPPKPYDDPTLLYYWRSTHWLGHLSTRPVRLKRVGFVVWQWTRHIALGGPVRHFWVNMRYSSLTPK